MAPRMIARMRLGSDETVLLVEALGVSSGIAILNLSTRLPTLSQRRRKEPTRRPGREIPL